MQDIHCKSCNALLLKAKTFVGEIKCKRCKFLNAINLISMEYEMRGMTEHNCKDGV